MEGVACLLSSKLGEVQLCDPSVWDFEASSKAAAPGQMSGTSLFIVDQPKAQLLVPQGSLRWYRRERFMLCVRTGPAAERGVQSSVP